VHEPSGYDCPFCRLLRGEETERNRLDDVVWRDEATAAFVSPGWWCS
jgi:histidine triad (HIT) family protein